MNTWYRVSLKDKITGEVTTLGHTQAVSENAAICQLEGFGIFGRDAFATCVPADEVPYKIRAFAEATTEELRNELRSRGWKILRLA